MADKPKTTEAMLLQARYLANSGQPAQALAAYRAILTRFPQNSRARDGLTELLHRHAGRPDVGAWNVARGHMAQLRPADAMVILRRLLPASPLNADLRRASAACLASLGQPEAALEHYQTLMLLDPRDTAARLGQANMLSMLGRGAEAEAAYRLVMADQPENPAALNNLGLTLQAQGRHSEASDLFARVVSLNPDDGAAIFNLANSQRDLGKIEAALAGFQAAMDRNPTHAGAANNLGILYEELGQRAAAETAYREALRRDPGFASAWRHLATVHRFQPGDPEISRIEAALAQMRRPDDRAQLLFALATARDATDDTAAAFRAFAEGNALRRAELDYDPSLDRRLFAAIRRAFDIPLAPLAVSPANPRPIFILGMMRSGTSVVEQILSAHSRVQAAGELEFLTRQALPLMERVEAEPDFRLGQADLQALRDGYLVAIADLAITRPVVTDKMPANFRWIGFILTAFPEARVVHLRRDPMAVGWSIFRTYFQTGGNGYAYDLEDIGAYNRLHDQLMDFWHARFPGRILEMEYQALTEDQEGQTRRLLDWCDLPWEEACLRFHQAEGRVRTASAGQVRQPMYRGSSDVWRRYEPFLGPLKAALAPNSAD